MRDRETLPVFGGGTRDIEVDALGDGAGALHRAVGRARATRRGALRERVPMSPRALQQAPFRVLVGANMPAVLVEMGFLTNPQQEQQLALGRLPERRRAGARRRHRPVSRRADAGSRRQREPRADARRCADVLLVVLAVVVAAWVLFIGLPRWYGTSRASPTPAAATIAGAGGDRRRPREDHRDAVLRRARTG